MSEIIKPPADWSLHLDLSASDLQTAIGKQRLISIKSYVRSNKRVYAGISVKDTISGLGWTGNMTPTDLRQEVKQAEGRLISLDAFWDTGANELRCAGVWIKNTEGWKWNFNVDLEPSDITAALKKESGKLTCLRGYTRPSKPKPPSAFVQKYCAIWIQDDGKLWNWDPNIAPSALALKLDDDVGRLVSIDNLTPDSWSPSSEKVAAIWWKNDTGAVWFWNIGLDAAALKKEFPKFCSYGLDVVPAGPVQFASIMCQFPKKPDPDEASLVAFTGSGAAKFRDDLGQDINWTLQQKNLTGTAVSYKTGVMLSAAEGGWCWWSGNFTDPSGQTILGLPLSIAANATNSSTPFWTVSNAPKIGVFCLRAEDGSGKHQELLAQAPITQAGFATPAKLPIAWPVFLGLIAPVESVKLTNGKNWVTVEGQICNGTTQSLTVTNAYVRLRDKSVILHEAYFTDKLMIDQDILGQSVSPPTVGAVSSSTAPLAKFFDGFAVPGNFSAGQLKVQINVKLGGNLDCYGDTRALTVKPAPVTNMTRLPYDKPVWSDPNVGTLRWHWGNGVGSTGFNAHSYPEHRYSYDVNVWDSQNKSLKAGGDPLKNEDYYCWNQPIRAMDPGTIHFVDDSNPDNQGNAGNVNNNPANLVIIYNKEKDVFQLYAHVRQHSAIDKNGNKLVVGAPVQAGDLIGRCGNAGGTSEPHLHVGISRRDSEGFLRSLPMTLSKIKNGSGQVVSGVPADNDFYSS